MKKRRLAILVQGIMCAAAWVESNLMRNVTLSSPIKLLLDIRYWCRVLYVKIYSFYVHNNLKCYHNSFIGVRFCSSEYHLHSAWDLGGAFHTHIDVA